MVSRQRSDVFFFLNNTATTDIYTLSLPAALPIWTNPRTVSVPAGGTGHADFTINCAPTTGELVVTDRKSTRLNSSHSQTSDAVFCLQNNWIYLGGGALIAAGFADFALIGFHFQKA